MDNQDSKGRFVKGHKHTQEAKEKNRLAHLGKSAYWLRKPKSQEIKDKISETKKNDPRRHELGMFGKSHSKEAKNKMSLAKKLNPSPSQFKKGHEGMIGKDNPIWNGGKKLWMARQNHRRKQLGSNFMNEPFEGSEGHHIDKENVLHIPKELHTSINHRLNNIENMNKINLLAFTWWESSVL